jgi:hypothetical protein
MKIAIANFRWITNVSINNVYRTCQFGNRFGLEPVQLNGKLFVLRSWTQWRERIFNKNLFVSTSDWIYKYCWVRRVESSRFIHWPSTQFEYLVFPFFVTFFDHSALSSFISIFLLIPQNPIQFLFEENVKSHDKAPSSNIRWHSFSNTAHLPTKSSEAGPIVMDWHRWISRLLCMCVYIYIHDREFVVCIWNWYREKEKEAEVSQSTQRERSSPENGTNEDQPRTNTIKRTMERLKH